MGVNGNRTGHCGDGQTGCVHLSCNIHTIDCWIVDYILDGMFCLIFVCLYFFTWSPIAFPSPWSISFFHIYFCISVFCPSLSSLSLLPHLLCPCFLYVSLDYLSLSSEEPSLTRSPWSSRAQWRESWIWWTTCLALSATTTHCPPGLASTTPTRRSIIARMMTHSLHFMCRAAHVTQENEV